MQLLTNLGEIHPIDAMPSLSKRLGKSRVDQIRATERPLPRSRGSRSLNNPIQANMLCLIKEPRQISDIVVGVCRNSDTDSSLNHKRLIVLLKTLDQIDTRRVQHVTGLGERQAQRYVQACRMAIPHIEKHFEMNPIRFDSTHTLI